MARMFRSLSAGVLAMALVAAGCGDDKKNTSSEDVGQGSGATTTSTAAAGAAGECKTEGTATGAGADEVVLTLNEFTIKASKEPKAGNVSIKGENAGKEKHEIVIVKGESADGLPKDADGGLDEDKLPEGGLIGEIEPFASGQVCSGGLQPAGRQVRAVVQHHRDRAER